MARRSGERREIHADEIEPIDLEPVELEPVDSPEVGPARRHGRPGDDRRRVGWLVALVAVVAGFTLVVFGRVHDTGHAAPPPRGAPTTGALPAVDDADPVSALARRLEPYWPDGEAIVMSGRLYVARARDARPALVVPELPAVIEDQSGSSLLISTFPELLVATEPGIASRVLSPRSVAVRAPEPGEWWILSDDGTLRDTVTGDVLRPPGGIRVAAALPNAFVALDVRHGQWVLWTGEPSTRPIINSRAQLVGARGSTVVFRSGCTIDGCALEILDLAHHSEVDAYLPGVPDFAVFSPTGSRLALASTLGDVFLVDPTNGALITRTRSRVLPSLSSPVAWSTDGQRLIVVQKDSVEVRAATDGDVSDVITGTEGLEQLAGLP